MVFCTHVVAAATITDANTNPCTPSYGVHHTWRRRLKPLFWRWNLTILVVTGGPEIVQPASGQEGGRGQEPAQGEPVK